MNVPEFKISFQDAAGDYLSAVKERDNTWTVSSGSTPAYLKTLPMEWDKTDITWERNMEYLGVFRSQTNQRVYSDDGRAILLHLIFGSGGVNAYCLMTEWIYNEATSSYDIFYQSEFEFPTVDDDKRKEMISAATVDNRLYELLKSRSGSQFMLPFWNYDPPPGSGDWNSDDATFLYHRGLKCFWRQDFIGAETPTAPLIYHTAGFDAGAHGALPNQGAHTLPALQNRVIVSNNGTTTYIGNDILEPVLKSSPQPPVYNEVNFIDNGNRNISQINPIQPLSDGTAVKYKFNLGVTFQNFVGGWTITYTLGIESRLKFVLFELNEDGEPNQTTPGAYDIFATLLDIYLPLGASPYILPSLVYDTSTDVQLNKGKAYVLGIIWDSVPPGANTTNVADYILERLTLSIISLYSSGTAAPEPAPQLPGVTLIGFRPMQAFDRLMNVFDSVETDPRGFPIPTGAGYIGASSFLGDDTLNPDDYYDIIPNRVIMTSENVLRNVVGNPYMSLSLNDFYGMCRKMFNCGLGIEGGNTIRIEPMEYWFENVLLLALGADIANLRIVPYVEMMGNVINGGYADPQINKNFGTDSFCVPMSWNLPLNSTPKPIDMQVTEVVADMYYIEKAIAQSNNNVSTPSASNTNVIFEVVDATVSKSVYDPVGNEDIVDAYETKTYPTAQSTDPTAAIPPYIKGFYYPDTVTNTGATPASNMLRAGSWWATMCDGVPSSQFISFRKQYNMQYNDYTTPATVRPGMSKKIGAGAPLVNEVDDVVLSDLPAKLFRPWILMFDSAYPVNMYSLINANPRRYISFVWKSLTYKGYIKKVTQCAGNRRATNFELFAHPDVTDAMLKI